MAEVGEIAVADLLLDEANARFPEPQASQQQACLALAKLQGGRALVGMAEDIVAHGMDPTNLPVVAPTSDSRKRYRVGFSLSRLWIPRHWLIPP
jgi:hypothetical protein